ncbi:MAG: hypothetical protein EHM64_13245 [Ignavibacteriae bacterium]|nr:MAG: hypothetical protein EHM64_13245 [Ignavibacteriota bacterium]
MKLRSMEMNITRREILRFVGGSALGILLTPVPWKALDDSAIWTQNWPWIPEPVRGESSYKLTSCTLCSASCGLRARCIGNQPVSLSGISAHPLNSGALCSFGIIAHHLRYHPARLSRPCRISGKAGASGSTAMAFDELLLEVAAAINDASASSQTVAIVDGRPGRTASHLFQQFAAGLPNGKYITAGESSLEILGSMFEKPPGPLAYDLDNSKMILSFGVPLLDRWGTPARTARYLQKKSEGKQRIIQVETLQSRTAGMADRWIPIRPGTEAAFALGIAHVILKDKLFRDASKDIAEFETMIAAYPPSAVAEICGVSQDFIRDTAREFSANRPSVAVIDGSANSRHALAAVMALNILVGNVGRKGGVVVHREIPSPVALSKNKMSPISTLDAIPDHSIRAMLIDESLSGSSLPDGLLQKKLTGNGILVSLSPFVTERPFCTQYVIPSPVFLESLAELTGQADRESSSLSLSAPLVPEPAGMVDPIQFIQRLGSAAGVMNIDSGTTEELLKKRMTAIYSEKRGSIFNASNGQTSELKGLTSPDELWNVLFAGGCWMDSPETVRSLPAVRLTSVSTADRIKNIPPESNQLLLLPCAEDVIYRNSEISPLMSKVGQESGLRPSGCKVYLQTATGDALGLTDGCRVMLQTKKGSMQAEVRLDPSMMPDVAAAYSALNQQNIISLCEMNQDASLQPTPVKIQKV